MKEISKLIGTNIVAAGLLAAAAVGLWTAVPAPLAATARIDQELAPMTRPASFADVIETVSPSVVNISSSAPAHTAYRGPGGATPFPDGQLPPGPSFEEFFRRFFERQSAPVPRGQLPMARSMGSGFIVDPDGLVVTNNHVIDGATEIVVTLNDGTQLDAELVGRDPKTDLALLRVETEGPLPSASFGNSSAMRVGDWVIAIGNPFGLGGTATTGIVSARGRDIRSGPFDDFLQIDAPINRGNSGGPLFDTAGRVIGVNTAIYSPNGGSVGIGFAIPASMVEPIVEQLRDGGYVERGWLGVQVQPLDEELSAGLGLPDATGALVASVVPDSPAETAGVRTGDVIVALGDEAIDDTKELVREVASVPPNRTVELEVWRDGDTVHLDVDLGENPDDLALKVEAENAGTNDAEHQLGLSLAELTPEARQRFGLEETLEGALVVGVAPGSAAETKGLRPGDVVLGVGQRPITDPAEVTNEIARLREAERPSIVLQVARGGASRFLAVPLT